MKLFKKALIASAVVSAFGAQAVTVSSTPIQISQEGSDFGLKAVVAETTGTDDFVLDFVVDKLTPSASTITLTFDDSVDLSNINAASSTVNNVIGTGTGTANLVTGNATFSYGTGSFTFDKFKVELDSDGDKDSISFDVNLGNPLTASSAFRIQLDGITNGVAIGGAAEVCYSSVDASGTAIESGCSPIAELVSQFSFDVSQEWDGKIERVEQESFSRNSDIASEYQDTLKFKISNDETLAAALTVATTNVALAGNFEAVTVAESTVNSGISAVVPTFATGEDEITFVLTTTTDLANDGTVQTGEYLFDSNGSGTAIVIPQTGEITATATFIDTTSVGTAATGTTVDLTDAAGSWMLDATVINVNYVPVLFADTQSNVHIANESITAASVMATAIDEFGVQHPSVDLGSVPGNTVMKYSQTTLADAFGITAETKLSVTFNIDGYAKDISAYATVQNAKGRTEVSNSQSKVDGKGL